MDTAPAIGEGEPIHWQICFVRRTSSRLVNFFVWGKFKHVRAFGFVPGEDVWIFYDVTLAGTVIRAARERSPLAAGLIVAWISGAEVLLLKRCAPRRMPPCGFWCVTAVKHLIGLRSGALLPGALYRDCLRHGATNLDEPRPASAAACPAARSGA